ncbi:MAG: hypothetical protein KJ720_01805 [Proteobacteria bacterium]|nr:hypothetical protein [Pseudomonadota bacterium]MBU1451167.1 hypothetical protein [Pseudomonadota bacterium]
MSTCRFMFNNFITGPEALGVSSARPGMVGSPAAEALGSATCLAAGEHTGDLDQMLVVEIDSVEAGTEVGLATFRWKRESAGAWEASGVPTTTTLTLLAGGVGVKWAPGPDQELYKGDRWSILATGRQGPQALMDRDRDTCWRSEECAGQWLGADLGQAQRVRALVLADHNLGEGATATLKGSPVAPEPAWSFDPGQGQLIDSLGQAGTNGRATGRTYIGGGVLQYAEAGASCFEDGLLSIQPAAVNLIARSEQFDQNPPWFTDRLAVATAAGAAPDGAITANLLAETAASGEHYFGTSGVTGLADDTVHAWSIFVRPNGRTWCLLTCRTKANAIVRTYFDLSGAGAIGTQGHGNAGIARLGSTDWYRIWVAHDMASGATLPQIYFGLASANGVNSYLGDGSSGVYAWGAQLERGSVATAYIPTTAGTASRAADEVSFPLTPAVQAAMSEGGEGCLALEWTPGLDHGDFTMDTTQGLVSTSGESGYDFLPLYLYRNALGARVSSYDQSRLRRTDAFVDFAAGQTYAIALRWLGGGDFQVGCGEAWGTEKLYEGSFNLSAGRISLGLGAVFPMRLGRVKIWDSHLEADPRTIMDPWEYPAHSQALAITRPHLTSFLDQTYRYWRLELDDPDNPEGLLRASLFYLGGCFEPQRGFRAGYGRGTVATRKLTASGGGKLAGSAGALAAYYQLEFARLSAEDAASFEQMLASAHSGGDGGLRPLYFTPFSDDPGQTLYCLPGAELARQQAPGGRWDLGLRLEEVVRTDV